MERACEDTSHTEGHKGTAVISTSRTGCNFTVARLASTGNRRLVIVLQLGGTHDPKWQMYISSVAITTRDECWRVVKTLPISGYFRYVPYEEMRQFIVTNTSWSRSITTAELERLKRMRRP